MSIRFQLSQYDDSLWFPGNHKARMYKALVEAVAAQEQLSSGLSEEWEDQFDIDLPVFEHFIGQLIRRYGTADHFVMRGAIMDIASIGSVMIERASGTLPTLGVEGDAVWAHRREVYGGLMGT